MQIRPATPADAPAVLAIYAPVVTDTAISFETEPPTVDEMRARIEATLRHYPWLVALDDRRGCAASYTLARCWKSSLV
jgi:L-amino acid N-acyltransferase YncA